MHQKMIFCCICFDPCEKNKFCEFGSLLSQIHNIGNNANIDIRGFTTWKQKKFQWQKVTPKWGLNLALWFQVKYSPCLANLECTT